MAFTKYSIGKMLPKDEQKVASDDSDGSEEEKRNRIADALAEDSEGDED